MAKKIQRAPDPAVVPQKRYGNEADTQEYIPQEASFAARTPAPQLLGRGEFRLMVHPEQWCVVGDRVVPYFTKLAARDGANGVQTRGGRLDMARAIELARDRGYTVLPIDAEGPGRSYLKRVTAVPNCYILTWQRARNGVDTLELDVQRMHAFADAIIARGFIQPPEAWVLQRLLQHMTDQRNRCAEATTPKRRAAVDNWDHQIAVVKAALEQAETRAAYAEEEEYQPEVSHG